ncbi:CU044_5270 family protein [Amycolatopsis sp., V23-08]|uniref:CU044_5270 family protein n=1 Tax=Amycolatopsis heterodermiae TaxID=3110235 RepID=A0ABU5R132_9PSEU|nr:CU044_5270 family protein [Amycolatopsis sp., V23-08]MEA5359911.1 CU044_5270 family protein [Amycolatopsis sp., V23-08]
MNDLQTLRAALTPDEPAQDVVDRSRHRLQNHMLAARRRRHVRPLAIGAGLVAVAAAAAVVVATLPGTPAPAPAPQAAAPVAVTGQEILLAAATVAAKAPASTGTYWHVKINASETYEYWTKADAHVWFRAAKTGGRVMPLGELPFRLGGAEVTMDRIQKLPAEPGALRDWITNLVAHSDIRTSAGPLTADQRQQAVLEGLVSLVSTLPAPPAVRAASFRAIAAYPGVRAVGAVPGGQGLQLPLAGEGLLVVDPATGRVNKTSTFVTAEGARYSAAEGTTIGISAEWTDSLPS